MEVLVSKLAFRIPEYIARAAAGDPTAIAMLAALGISAAVKAIKEIK